MCALLALLCVRTRVTISGRSLLYWRGGTIRASAPRCNNKDTTSARPKRAAHVLCGAHEVSNTRVSCGLPHRACHALRVCVCFSIQCGAPRYILGVWVGTTRQQQLSSVHPVVGCKLYSFSTVLRVASYKAALVCSPGCSTGNHERRRPGCAVAMTCQGGCSDTLLQQYAHRGKVVGANSCSNGIL